MALNKVALKNGIKGILNELKTREDNQADAIDYFATELSDIIDTYVKAAEVKTQVTTTGSATAQTGVGIGTLS